MAACGFLGIFITRKVLGSLSTNRNTQQRHNETHNETDCTARK